MLILLESQNCCTETTLLAVVKHYFRISFLEKGIYKQAGGEVRCFYVRGV